MTRVFTALCVFFCELFSLNGCARQHQPSLHTAFEAEFSARYRDLEPCGRLTYTAERCLTLELDSPGSLEGLNVGYCGGELSLRRGELRCTADEAYLPAASFPAMLKAALGALSDASANGQLVFDGQETQLETPAGICSVTVDGEGLPVTIKVDDCTVELRERSAL